MTQKNATLRMVIALIFISFFISYFLLSYYTGGDQVYYGNFYAALYGSNIEDAVSLSITYTGGGEPLTALILWIGANLGIEKIVYISLFNIILTLSLFLLARKNQVKPPMIFLLLTNFYFFVLLTSAERLKMAYIFTIIAMLFVGKVRLFLLTCSPFAHFQNFILIACVVLARFEEDIKNLIFNFRISKKSIMMLIGLVMGSVPIVFFSLEAVSGKFEAYTYLASVSELVNIMLLAPIAIYVSRKRLRMILVLLPLFPLIMLIGSIRINMIAVTLVIYFLMIERRIHHPLIYLIMTYFSVKTIGYVYRILTAGDGF